VTKRKEKPIEEINGRGDIKTEREEDVAFRRARKKNCPAQQQILKKKQREHRACSPTLKDESGKVGLGEI